ncbi:hypothetical protein [Enterobacter hormaechei]
MKLPKHAPESTLINSAELHSKYKKLQTAKGKTFNINQLKRTILH